MEIVGTILIIDDEASAQKSIESLLLDQGYRLVFASNGTEGLDLARQLQPDLVLLDVMMPGMDGYEVCDRLRADPALAEAPIIMISALDDRESRLRGIEAGVDDFISKPFDRTEMRVRVRTILRLNRYRKLRDEHARIEKAYFELQKTYDTTIEGWVRALDIRDKETEGHTQRVTEMTLRLARSVGIAGEALVHIRRGALLHDIGKMAIPDSILLNEGKLSEAEWRIMRLHPIYAHEWLSSIEYLRPALEIPYHHHERWDGGGYPLGLQGEEIPLAARCFAIADVWDALLSERPYKSAWVTEEALDYIRANAGQRFDPSIVEKFLALIELDAD
ncbi:MAG: response regulator [Chloroflexi bacterium]|nr:response regulator [Chloroflexota bacterium]